ncbi:hypothetical protein [Polyangium sorediatum]|uniref:Uncharacterized protein n=1 Tax=Polyangium sorediatum TaxID=889274 RepID=A0ABT6NKF4_9BACT|nr:hypothetical protein [Polyangium sorediatum]MDI1428794.1 hypothetical protein [Polyangium sorediatum]
MPKRQPQSQTAAPSTPRPRRATRTTKPDEPKVAGVLEDEAPPAVIPTEFAFGTDGCLYINTKSLKPGQERNRAKFVGYQLTEEEKEHVMDTLHLVAWNATAGIFDRKKRRG